jgi:hypothetical protein
LQRRAATCTNQKKTSGTYLRCFLFISPVVMTSSLSHFFCHIDSDVNMSLRQ